MGSGGLEGGCAGRIPPDLTVHSSVSLKINKFKQISIGSTIKSSLGGKRLLLLSTSNPSIAILIRLAFELSILILVIGRTRSVC